MLTDGAAILDRTLSVAESLPTSWLEILTSGGISDDLVSMNFCVMMVRFTQSGSRPFGD